MRQDERTILAQARNARHGTIDILFLKCPLHEPLRQTLHIRARDVDDDDRRPVSLLRPGGQWDQHEGEGVAMRSIMQMVPSWQSSPQAAPRAPGQGSWHTVSVGNRAVARPEFGVHTDSRLLASEVAWP